MERISPMMLYPLIIGCGVLQAWGPPMNGALRVGLTNPWLATLISFLPISFVFALAWFCIPQPFPTVEGVSQMPWWAPLGRIVGAFAVVAGLLFVDKVGAGAFDRPIRSVSDASPPFQPMAHPRSTYGASSGAC